MAYGIWYDEVALWGDTDRFSALELQQMYELGKDRRVPLPEFTDTWDDEALSHSGFIPAHTISVEPMSGDMTAFVGAHLYQHVAVNAVIPYFPAITGKPYTEKMVYYLTGMGEEELVAGQSWDGPLGQIATIEGSGFAAYTELTSMIHGPYSVVGVENLTWHVLAKDVTEVLAIGSSPALELSHTGGTIMFGAAVWTTPAIQDLLACLRDGQAHYLVINLRHAGAGSWLLNVSKDGRPYVSYGLQTFGSNPVPSQVDPTTLLVDSAEPGGYADEVILWTNVDFTPDELAELGHAPPLAFAEGRGFLGNYEMPTSDTSDYTVESLLKTHDHHPQIIGKLDVEPPEEVNIQVWACTGGTATPVTLADDACYPIGSTGRWGWSTENLPAWPNKHPQYFYRMTAGNGTVFEGVFILSSQRKYRGVPRSSSEFIVRRD